MFFLGKANWRFHKSQYIASAVAVIICCFFVFGSAVVANVIGWVTENPGKTLEDQSLTLQGVQSDSDAKPESKIQATDQGNQTDPKNENKSVLGKVNLAEYLQKHPEYQKVFGLDAVKNPDLGIYQILHTELPKLTDQLGADTQISYHAELPLYLFHQGKNVSLAGTVYEPKNQHYQPQILVGKYPSSGNSLCLLENQARFLGVKVGDRIKVAADQSGKGQVEATINCVLRQNLQIQFSMNGQALYAADLLGQLGPAVRTRLSTQIQLMPGAKLAGVSREKLDLTDHKQLQHSADELQKILRNKGLDFTRLLITVPETKTISDGQGTTIAIQTFFAFFQGLAVIFAIVVVANTYQVVLSRRRRENALLRCLGASVSQLRRAQLWECFFLGLAAAVVGTIFSYLLVAVGLWYSGQIGNLAETLTVMGIFPVVLSLLVGIITPMLAGIRPTWRAAKISPMAALNQIQFVTSKQTKRHIIRTGLGIVLILIGGVINYQALQIVKETFEHGHPEYAMPVAMGGCVVVLFGLILVALTWLPVFTSWLLKPFSKRWAVADMVRIHFRYEPYRVGATATALMVGLVTVATLVIGEHSVDVASEQTINREYPVDMVINYPAQPAGTADRLIKKLKGIKTVKKVEENSGLILVSMVDRKGKELLSAPIKPTKTKTAALPTGPQHVALISKPNWKEYLNSDPNGLNVRAGEIWLPVDKYNKSLVKTGPWTVTFQNGSTLTLQPKFLSPRLSNQFSAGQYLISQVDSKKVIKAGAQPQSVGAFMKINHNSGIYELYESVIQIYASVPKGDIYGQSASGGIMFIAVYRLMITIMLGVLLVLLGICAVISLIGVANTLILSTVDRAKENALLRTLGFDRSQVRLIVTLEAFLIGVGSLLVSLLTAIIFAGIGIKTVPLNSDRDLLQLHIPITWVLVIIAVTLLCCIGGAIAPGRQVSRQSPVAALSGSQ